MFLSTIAVDGGGVSPRCRNARFYPPNHVYDLRRIFVRLVSLFLSFSLSLFLSLSLTLSLSLSLSLSLFICCLLSLSLLVSLSLSLYLLFVLSLSLSSFFSPSPLIYIFPFLLFHCFLIFLLLKNSYYY